jgi:hypothetical protein
MRSLAACRPLAGKPGEDSREVTMPRCYLFSRFPALALLLLWMGVAVPARAQLPLTTYIPIAGMPSEDVDMVELVPTPVGLPPTIVYPTETAVNFINMTSDAVYASVAKPGPNISGTDYVQSPDGTVGVLPILGRLCVFSQGPGAPALVMTISLPGTPARRDIDVTIVPGLLNPWDAIYATGTEVHRIDLTTGAIWWTTPLPSPIVEAVDPLYVASTGIYPGPGTHPVVFVATDGFMTEINALTGAIVNPGGIPTATGTTVIREVDIRLNPAGTLVFLHGNFVLDAFSTATGLLASSVGLSSMGIEGNDIEWDNTGTRGAAITVASMVWFNAGTGAVTDVIPFVSPGGTPYGHQRNQDIIFTAPGVAPQMAGYLAQGAFFLYFVPALPGAIGLVAATPTPSTTMDGVDPLTTDASSSPAFPPAAVGVVALVPTQGYISELDLRTGAMVSLAMAPGVLRTDVDVRRGGTPGNKDYQPYIGGVAVMSGFLAGQYTVTVSNGVQVVNVSTASLAGFIPTGMIFRGGDEQVSTLLGPPAPAYTTDDPDQDFLTKCWEYKYTMNRWPMWYGRLGVLDPTYLWYPHFLPYGVFGPPALSGWDIWNDWKVMVLNTQRVVLLNRGGFLKQTILLPARPIGGLIWDWDNKLCKLRLYGQQEAIINLATVATTGLATVTYVPYGLRTEWYPIVDRMNGWEFVVARGCRRIWVYDHIVSGFVTWIDLPARIIRPPVFDEQRKTLCCALANRQVFFFNAHTYRVTLSIATASLYTVALPQLVVADPVFDIYNHHTLVRFYGGNVGVIDNSTANLVYTTGVLPYWPIGPVQVDCYNKVAKWNAYNGVDYAEYWMDLYPLVKIPVGSPVLRQIPLGPVRPFGYPQFDSRDGWEYTRLGNAIRYDYLFSPYTTNFYVPPGVTLTGNLFIDRVNKYALCATTTNQIVWVNLFRLTHGLAGATSVLGLLAPATQGIHFLTQLHLAAVTLQGGQIAIIDMADGNVLVPAVGGAPPCTRQIYVQPFSGLCNYPYWDGAQGYDVTVDLNPLRRSILAAPTVHVEPLGVGNTSNEAANFTGPLPISAALIAPLAHQIGDDYAPELQHFQIQANPANAGLNFQADDMSKRDTEFQMDPVSGTLEDDGSGEFTVIAAPGDQVCIRLYDPEGNASSETCILAVPRVSVGGPGAPQHNSFALASSNPVQGKAQFRYALPTRARVQLGIYDMSGRRVASLVSQDRDPGEYEETWDLTTASGEPASAGVYFAKFQAGSFKDSKRVVVLR